MNLYLVGAGGQGIGILSETILRAAHHAGFPVKGVDTHGLAQRGGVVVSQIRTGDAVHSPLIPMGMADMVIALERHEAMRGMKKMLKQTGTLVYCDIAIQPLFVRLGEHAEITAGDIEKEAKNKKVTVMRVSGKKTSDPRLHNTYLLSFIAHKEVIPGLSLADYENAMKDLMKGEMLEKNLTILNQARQP